MPNRVSPRIREFRVVDDSNLGYSTTEVDAYFSRLADDFELLRAGHNRSDIITSDDIRVSSFTPEKGGYTPADVDRALDKVEDRFAKFERSRALKTTSIAQWQEQAEEEARIIIGRLDRSAGERFRRPSRKLTKGYYVGDVDALCERLKHHFYHDDKLSPAIIRGASFRLSTGNTCYEETQVDAFLDRCIKLILDIR